MTLVAWILAASVAVTDAHGHHFKAIPQAGAEAIADGCTRTPLFTGHDGARQCAALLVVMAARESAYRLDALGDGGRAHGPFQVWGHAPTTWAAAVAQYIPIVRRSIAACDEPLELLAAGRCGVPRAKAISRERMREAHRVFGVTKWEADDDG